MKTFNEFLSESRNFGTHTFGMEPSVNDYIKGLDAAEARKQKEAEVFKKSAQHKSIKGKFGTTADRYGSLHGKDGFEGYKLSKSTDIRSPSSKNVWLHSNTDVDEHVGQVVKVGDKFSAKLPEDGNVYHDSYHGSEGAALRYIIAKHKAK